MSKLWTPGAELVPTVDENAVGGVVDVSNDGRTVTINLSAKNALPMREIMATRKNVVPFVLAKLSLAVLSEIDGGAP